MGVRWGEWSGYMVIWHGSDVGGGKGGYMVIWHGSEMGGVYNIQCRIYSVHCIHSTSYTQLIQNNRQ